MPMDRFVNPPSLLWLTQRTSQGPQLVWTRTSVPTTRLTTWFGSWMSRSGNEQGLTLLPFNSCLRCQQHHALTCFCSNSIRCICCGFVKEQIHKPTTPMEMKHRTVILWYGHYVHSCCCISYMVTIGYTLPALIFSTTLWFLLLFQLWWRDARAQGGGRVVPPLISRHQKQ